VSEPTSPVMGSAITSSQMLELGVSDYHENKCTIH
jgi:hypothetical protein